MTRLTDVELKAALASHEHDDMFAEPPTDAKRELARAIRESLTRLFLAHWQRNELPELQAEFHFHPSRKWAFDYALPDYKIAVEVDGGTRQQGRHNRAEGYAKDAEKINAATGIGWRVFRFSDVMIKEGQDAMDFYLQPIRELLEAVDSGIIQRLQEMEYAVEGGNLAREDVPADELKNWFRYVWTGEAVE